MSLSLSELQNWVQNRILQDEIPTAEESEAVLSDTKKFSHKERWNVYRYAIKERMFESLIEDFEAVHGTLGESVARSLMKEYFEKHPSGSPTFLHLGEHFESFVSTHNLSQKHAWLKDMAQFEFALLKCGYVDTSQKVPFEKLSLIDLVSPEKIHLKFRPGITLIESDFALIEMYKRQKMIKKHGFYIVYPTEFAGYFDSLSETDFKILDKALKSENLLQLLEYFESQALGTDVLFAFFQKIMQCNWIEDIEIINEKEMT